MHSFSCHLSIAFLNDKFATKFFLVTQKDITGAKKRREDEGKIIIIK
jgi:hypothetical protein